jgi:hypothetical protein
MIPDRFTLQANDAIRKGCAQKEFPLLRNSLSFRSGDHDPAAMGAMT